VALVFLVLMLGYAAVFAQLVRLQLVEHEMWSRESRRSSKHVTSLPFERGWILDRDGVPLARTEAVDDLTFSYRAWRRGAVSGLVSGASWTLGARWRLPSLVRASVADDLASLGALSVGELAGLQPYKRRSDLVGFYIERLFGRSVSRELSARLREDPLRSEVTVAELPGFEQGLSAARVRASHEADAWARLVALVGPELVQEVDDVAQRAMGTVAREAGLPSNWSTAGVLEREGWNCVQALQAEFEHQQIEVWAQVSYDAATLLALRGDELPGLGLSTRNRRVYPEAVADTAALLVGRVGPITQENDEQARANRVRLAWLQSLDDLSPEELDEHERLRVQVRELDYRITEERGQMGLERALESQLRGRRGWESRWLDAAGEPQREAEVARRGRDVHLTLDAELQRAAEGVLVDVWQRAPEVPGDPAGVPEHWAGAIVLLDPRSGDVLVAASGPRATRQQLDGAELHETERHPAKLLYHRALYAGARGVAPPPGSTFKPVSALAGLSAGVITAGTRFSCDGGLGQGRWRMHCLGNHGEIDLARALAVSCNVYFYRLGQELGAEPLAALARLIGFGGPLPLLQGNRRLLAAGVDPRWGFSELSLGMIPGPWDQRDAMSLAIGQAPLDDVTPLQVASMMAAIGSGFVRPPRLVAAIDDVTLVDDPAVPLPVAASHLAAVRAALAGVVDPKARGTAAELARRHPALAAQVAAKTGTAEVDDVPDQSWFAGYLPRDNPRLAFAVLVEDCGLHGSEAALPVFLKLLDTPAMRRHLAEQVLPGVPLGEAPR